MIGTDAWFAAREAHLAGTESSRQTLALAWAWALPAGPSNDRAVLAWVESQVWGSESGHMVAQVLRARGVAGTVPRLLAPGPTGRGGGRADIVVHG